MNNHLSWIGASAERDPCAVRGAQRALPKNALRNRPISRLSPGERRQTLDAYVLAQEPGIQLIDDAIASKDIHRALVTSQTENPMGFKTAMIEGPVFLYLPERW
jgi:ABC-type cobalamin/Fe3+-siderophores transport system ATPase subunit